MRWSRIAGFAAVVLALAGCGTSTRQLTVPSSAMEPTLHCAKPGVGCRGTTADQVIVDVGRPVERGDVIAFGVPRLAFVRCGANPGPMLKRVVGLPGETVRENRHGFISFDGKRLAEPYVSAAARRFDSVNENRHWHVHEGEYFVMGDNRFQSCDSRVWGGLPQKRIIGPVVKINRG